MVWEICSGQLLPVDRNQALFSLIAFTFGGDGRTVFALPNMSSPPVPSGMDFCIGVGGDFPPRSLQSEVREESLPDTTTLPEEEGLSIG